jgi:hypothetical protein
MHTVFDFENRNNKTHRRLTVLAAALTMGAANARAFELRGEYVQIIPTDAPSVNMSMMVATLVTQVRTLDTVVITVILCIIAAAIVVYSMVVRDALGRRSHVYLQILSARKCMQIRLATLPDATRRYVVRVSSSALCLRLQNYLICGVLHISPKAPKIVNTLTGETYRLSSYKLLMPWTAWHLRRHLAAGLYTVAPMLVHSHEYVFISDQSPPAYNGQVV